MVDDRQVAVLLFELFQDLAGAVLRAVIDHDDLLLDRDGTHPPEDFVDRVPLVIDRNDDREGQRLGNPEETQLAAERLAQSFEKPVPAFGVVSEFGHRGTQRDVVRRPPSTGEKGNAHPSPGDPPGLRPIDHWLRRIGRYGLPTRRNRAVAVGSPTNAIHIRISEEASRGKPGHRGFASCEWRGPQNESRASIPTKRANGRNGRMRLGSIFVFVSSTWQTIPRGRPRPPAGCRRLA